MAYPLNEEQYCVTDKKTYKKYFRLKASAINHRNEMKCFMGGDFWIIYDPTHSIVLEGERE